MTQEMYNYPFLGSFHVVVKEPHPFNFVRALKRRDPATIAGDYNHLGMLMHQTNGNRYLPGWNYKTPVNKFWMCGTSCHPGGGVMGGGRAAVQPVMEEMGIDFEKLIES